MQEQRITVKADTLEEAREVVRAQLLPGVSVLSERVETEAIAKTLVARAETTEMAFANAEHAVPPGATIAGKKEQVTPQRRTVALEARTKAQAREQLRGQLAEDEVLLSLELSVAPKRLMGLVRKPGQYDATILRPAVVELTYRTKATFAFTVGPKATYESIHMWGSFGTGDGQFYAPVSVAVDGQGNVYVSDLGVLVDNETNKISGYISRVQKFDSQGGFLHSWGSYGEDEGQFLSAQGVAVDAEGYVYVADSRAGRVQKFSPDGEFVLHWGSKGKGEGQFGCSTLRLAVAPGGSIYVSDRSNYRIQKFDSEGKFLCAWGSEGKGDGQLNWPEGIAVDSQGSVYVADGGNNRVQKFDPDGRYVTQWGSRGEGDGQFKVPRGIAVDRGDYVYVCGADVRVQKFDPEGEFIAKWGSEGREPGQFDRTEDLAVDADGNVYVLEVNNSRVQVFA
jgi:DNA-binding beta-propeller fold protein YncE